MIMSFLLRVPNGENLSRVYSSMVGSSQTCKSLLLCLGQLTSTHQLQSDRSNINAHIPFSWERFWSFLELSRELIIYCSTYIHITKRKMYN
jgi:hypothetical protein